MQVKDYSTSNIVDYSIEALLKKGGKVTGCQGFSEDPEVCINACESCANLNRRLDDRGGCLKPYGGTDCYVWVTMPNGDVIGACHNYKILTNSSNNK